MRERLDSHNSHLESCKAVEGWVRSSRGESGIRDRHRIRVVSYFSVVIFACSLFSEKLLDMLALQLQRV
jgi:hypothetical protein